MRPGSATFVVMPGVTYPIVERDDTLTGTITLGVVPSQSWTEFRSRVTGDKPIRPKIRCVVLVGGRAIGGFGVKLDTRTSRGLLPGPVAELITFASPEIDDLDRLVINAALSVEAKAVIERIAGRRVRSLVTSVLADGETSYVHRSMHLVERVPAKRGAPSRFVLVYGRTLGGWTLAEMLDEWRAAHGR